MTHIRTRARTTAAAAVLIALGSAGGVAHAQEAAVSPTDETFLTGAHQGNLAEIAAGEDAMAHAATACVKDAGEMLVADHGRLDEAVTALAGRLGVALPDAPTPEQQAELEALQPLAGTPAYDEAWLTAQAEAHQETLALIDRELSEGENAEVRAAAEAARPVVEAHLAMVSGGECHAAVGPASIPAGLGGADAPRAEASADGGLRSAGAAALVGGALLTAAGTVRLVVRARAADSR